MEANKPRTSIIGADGAGKRKQNAEYSENHVGLIKAIAHVDTKIPSKRASATMLSDVFWRVDSRGRARIDPKINPEINPPRWARTSEFKLKPKSTKRRMPARTPLIT